MNSRFRVFIEDLNGNPVRSFGLELPGWNSGSIQELWSVLGEKLGAPLGLLPARVEPSGDRVRFILSTDQLRAYTDPVRVPPVVLGNLGVPLDGSQFSQKIQPRAAPLGIDMLDLHLPLFSGTPGARGTGFNARSPIVYGTVFPIAHGGIFATAGHVVRDARSDGTLAIGRRNDSNAIQVFSVDDFEIFEGIDFALLKCSALEHLTPLPIDFDQQLAIFDEVSVMGYPFSVDPEHLTVVHRGFIGAVVTRRHLYHLGQQPPGYELSFLTPRGTSGAPLVSRQRGSHYCYGYVIQQSTYESGGERVQFGLAVAADALLWLSSRIVAGPLAHRFGREPVSPRPVSAPRGPWGDERSDDETKGWPD